MKCIQAVVENNKYKLGHISRLENKEADIKVSTGYWKFVPKSKWKAETRGVEAVATAPTLKETPKKKKTKKQ
jgi:hypothetical protein